MNCFMMMRLEAARLPRNYTKSVEIKMQRTQFQCVGFLIMPQKNILKHWIELGKVAVCELSLKIQSLIRNGEVRRCSSLTPGTYRIPSAKIKTIISIDLPLVGKRFALLHGCAITGELKTQLENLEASAQRNASGLMCRVVVLVDSDATEDFAIFISMQILISTIEKDEINAEDCTYLVSELER